MIYLDNAATTYPKPEDVYLAHDAYLRRAANPGRGAHALSMESARALFDARLSAARFIQADRADRLVFTPGCTYSINTALFGLGLQDGATVVTSALEHNAVMRPLGKLAGEGSIRLHVLDYAPGKIVDAGELKSVISRLRPALCLFTALSNLTGEALDLEAVAAVCRSAGVPLMIDAAQSAGLIECGVDRQGIDVYCASGHKSLMGAPGAGLLYLSPAVDVSPTIYGGTGSRSEDLAMPLHYPDRLEAGTLAGPAIASLAAGIAWIEKQGLPAISSHESALRDQFLHFAAGRSWLTILGDTSQPSRSGIVSFVTETPPPDAVAARLDHDYGIAVRAGLHCAGAAHRALGSERSGAVRASFGWFNSSEDVDRLCEALLEICR